MDTIANTMVGALLGALLTGGGLWLVFGARFATLAAMNEAIRPIRERADEARDKSIAASTTLESQKDQLDKFDDWGERLVRIETLLEHLVNGGGK